LFYELEVVANLTSMLILYTLHYITLHIFKNSCTPAATTSSATTAGDGIESDHGRSGPVVPSAAQPRTLSMSRAVVGIHRSRLLGSSQALFLVRFSQSHLNNCIPQLRALATTQFHLKTLYLFISICNARFVNT